MSTVTALVVTYGRPMLLRRCLKSLSTQGFPISVLINGTDTESQRVAQEFSVTSIICLEESVTPAEARNKLLAKVESEWVYFIDDDAFVPPYFLAKFNSLMANKNFDVLGGPNLTPPDSGFFQFVSGKALGCVWGAGPSWVRYEQKKINGLIALCDETWLILCNLLIRKSVLNSAAFEVGFVCGEENSLLRKLSRRGVLQYYSPEIFVYHERRQKVQTFFSQIFKYGIGRGQNIKKTLNFNFYHLIPVLFLVFLISASSAGIPMGFILKLYFGLNLFFAVKASIRMPKQPLAFLTLLFLFPVIHIIYALGILRVLLFRDL